MGKSSKSKTTNEPSAYAKGYITPAANSLGSAYNANSGHIQSGADAIWSKLPGMMDSAFTPGATSVAANENAQKVLGGDYLNGNQYLDGMINSTANDVSDRVNSTYSMAGRTGGTQHTQALGRELSTAENNLRYGNYAQERQNQMAALGLAPQLEASKYAGMAPTLAAYQAASGTPISAAQGYAGTVGSMMSPYGTQTTTQKQGFGNVLGGVLGAGLSGWASGGFKL
jgi:hypothetical protein